MAVLAGKRQGDGFRGDRTRKGQVGSSESCNDVMSLVPSPRTMLRIVWSSYVPRLLTIR